MGKVRPYGFGTVPQEGGEAECDLSFRLVINHPPHSGFLITDNYQQASPLDCHIGQSAAACQGQPPETPGKCPIKTHVFSERSEAMKMEIAAKDRTHEEQQIKRLLAYQK